MINASHYLERRQDTTPLSPIKHRLLYRDLRPSAAEAGRLLEYVS
jgi:hypothetical protein